MKINLLKENLVKMGYAVSIFEKKDDARDYLKEKIQNNLEYIE